MSASRKTIRRASTQEEIQPLVELCKAGGAPKKPQIVKALRDETGCSKSGAYKAIERAEHDGNIHYTKATKTYVTK